MREMKDSGIEWIGEIPDTWTIKRMLYCLDSVVDYRGKTPEKVDEGILLVTAKNIKDGKIDYEISREYVREELYDEIMHRGKLKIGDVLFTTEAPLGEVANVDSTDFALAQRVIKFRADDTKLDNYYLKYYLMAPNTQQFLQMLSSGSTAAGIKASKLPLIKIPLPDIDPQRKIVSFLNDVCLNIDKIASDIQHQIELLQEYKQSVITEAVTKGLDKNVAMKDSGIDWIGNIPHHWTVKKVKYLGDSRNGLTYKPIDIVDKNEGTLVLRSSNIQDGKLVFDDNVYVSSRIPKNLKVKKGDILICSRNGSRELIGKNTLIDDVDATFGAFMMIYRCIAPRFIYYVLNSEVFKYYLGTFFTSTINQLTGSNFNNMKIVFCPDEEERQKITNYLDEKCSKIDVIIADKQKQLDTLIEYKKSLIYEYVTGKKEVPADA